MHQRKSFREFADLKKEDVNQPLPTGQEGNFNSGFKKATGATAVNVKNPFVDRLSWAVSKLARAYPTMTKRNFERQILGAIKQIVDNPNLVNLTNVQGGRVNFTQAQTAPQQPQQPQQQV
jgi:hypothetical protein